MWHKLRQPGGKGWSQDHPLLKWNNLMQTPISKWTREETETLIPHYSSSLVLLPHYDYLCFNLSPKHTETFCDKQCGFSPFTALMGR